MLSTTLVAIVAALVCATQAAPRAAPQDALDDVFARAKEYSKRFSKDVADVLKDVDETTKDTLNSSIYTAQRGLEDFHRLLKKASDDAATKGVDVAKCLDKASDDKILPFYETFIREATQCVADEEIEKLEETFQASVYQVNKLVSEVQKAMQKCSKLGFGAERSQCREDESARLTADLEKAEKNGESVMADAAKTFMKMYARMEACIGMTIATNLFNPQQLVTDALRCAENKIAEASNPIKS